MGDANFLIVIHVYEKYRNWLIESEFYWRFSIVRSYFSEFFAIFIKLHNF